MRDLDIRRELHRQLSAIHSAEPDTLIIDELGLCQGTVIIDVAVVNGSINGFEIKSERDTLERLPLQQEYYSKTLDTVTVVASSQHMDRVLSLVPDWWGLVEARSACGGVRLEPIRPAATNPHVDPRAVVELLWRDEALDALKELGLAKGMLSKPRRALWQKLADTLPVDELRELVPRKLKRRRPGWRAAPAR